MTGIAVADVVTGTPVADAVAEELLQPRPAGFAQPIAAEPPSALRIAVLSGVCANPIALDAVLEDVRTRGGADAYWVLGDVVAGGYDPVAAVERLVVLPGGRFVRGDTDRYVATGERPAPDDAGESFARALERAESFAWAQGALAATGWLCWLDTLPPDQHLTLPDGTRLLGVHAAPGRDDGPGLSPEMGDAELRAAVAACGADLVVAGHTGVPLDRTTGNVRVINTGSVANPVTADPRASYVLLRARDDGYSVQFRRVPYDYEAAIAAARRSRHPAALSIAEHLRGWEQSSYAAS